MPIDLAVLATTVVSSFLLPYLKLGGEKLAEEISEKVGSGTADYAADLTNKIWKRVKSVFSSERDQHAMSEFEEEPDAAKSLIEAKLKKKLEQDPTLAEELDRLINTPTPDGASTGAQIMNAHIAGILDARGTNFSNSRNLKLAGVMMEESQSSANAKREKEKTEEDS